MGRNVCTVVVFAFGALSLVACGTEPHSGCVTCNPGTALPCVCAGTATPGSQVCAADGLSLSLCECGSASSGLGSALDPNVSNAQRVLARIVDVQKPMPQPPNAPLTAEQITVLTHWGNDGMPKGTTTSRETFGAAGASAADGGAGSMGDAVGLV